MVVDASRSAIVIENQPGAASNLATEMLCTQLRQPSNSISSRH
jgi:hypothetical protein